MIVESKQTIEVAFVGKYIRFCESYLSMVKSFETAGYANKVIVIIKWIESSNLESK